MNVGTNFTCKFGSQIKGPRTIVILMRENGQLNGLQFSRGEVLAGEGHKYADRAHSGVRSEATLDSTMAWAVFEVPSVGASDLLGGEDASESKEAGFRILKGRGDIVALMQQRSELGHWQGVL